MSRVGGTRSMIFTPPGEAHAPAGRDIRLHTEPEDLVPLFGLMLQDAGLIRELLTGLPFSGAEYRGNLRVLRGAALRLKDRASRLLGELESEG